MVGIMIHAPNVRQGLRLWLEKCIVRDVSREGMLCPGQLTNDF